MKKLLTHDFGTLKYNFLQSDTRNKIMLLKPYESEEAHWGEGTIVQIEKAHSFLLHIIQNWYQDNKEHVIGDINALINATGELDEHQLDAINRRRQARSIATRRKRQLNTLLKRDKLLKELAQKNFSE